MLNVPLEEAVDFLAVVLEDVVLDVVLDDVRFVEVAFLVAATRGDLFRVVVLLDAIFSLTAWAADCFAACSAAFLRCAASLRCFASSSLILVAIRAPPYLKIGSNLRVRRQPGFPHVVYLVL